MTTFVERRRAQLRRHAKKRSLVVGALLAPPVLAAAAAFSPVLDVDTVRVAGNTRATASVIRDAAGVDRGTPLATLDLDAIRARVTRLPQVKSATVTREWPATLSISVVERIPVVAVRRPGRFDLVDLDGVLVETATAAPPNTPTLSYPGEPTGAVVGATVDLMRALPPEIRKHVRDLSSDVSGSLSFSLADGAVVVWGSGERTDDKVRVLSLLLRQHARRYDVRVPDRPAVVPR